MSDWQWLKLQKRYRYWQRRWLRMRSKREINPELYSKTYFQKQVLEFCQDFAETGAWPKPYFISGLPQYNPDILEYHKKLVESGKKVLKSL